MLWAQEKSTFQSEFNLRFKGGYSILQPKIRFRVIMPTEVAKGEAAFSLHGRGYNMAADVKSIMG